MRHTQTEMEPCNETGLTWVADVDGAPEVAAPAEGRCACHGGAGAGAGAAALKRWEGTLNCS